MALSKGDFEKLDSRLKSIIEQPVEQIEVSSDLPPTIEQLEDNNKTYAIMAAILFIDIRKSTMLTENSHAKSMVKIYRSFMRMAVECVRKNGGVTRQFLGDRIMGVFIDSTDENGTITEKAVDKAINSARSLQTTIDFSLNKYLKSKVNGKTIDCGIGIDYGKVLVTKVGMYGVEHDEGKENEVDCVWVGNTTNHASKYSDLAAGGEIFISETVYVKLTDCYKEVWTPVAKYKGTKLYQGYVTRDFYLDFHEDLGSPIKAEQDNIAEIDTGNQLLAGVKEIERLQTGLIQREREIAVLEERLKNENQRLINQFTNEKAERMQAQRERDRYQNELHKMTKSYYDFLCEVIEFAHCKSGYTQYVTEEFWNKIIAECFRIGNKLGYEDKKIKAKIDCGLIAIYSYYKRFKESYDAIVVMAETNSVWVNMEESTLKWAKENFVLHRLQNAIECRLVNYTVSSECRQDFENALQKVKNMRGV